MASGCLGLESLAASQEDVGRRPGMEDRHRVANVSAPCAGGLAGYVGIFDGHGGHWTARWLERSMHRRLRWRERRVEEVLEEAFVSFDEEQLEYRKSVSDEKGTGSTALVVGSGERSVHCFAMI